jgi:LysR family hydrogen peroxide-inducible transcriptional activator
LDLVVASLSIRNPDLLWSEVFREAMCLVVSPTHPLASATVAEWTALESERLLILKDGHCFRDQILAACTRHGTHVKTVFESDQFSSIFPLVASFRGEHHSGDGRTAGHWVLRRTARTSERSQDRLLSKSPRDK